MFYSAGLEHKFADSPPRYVDAGGLGQAQRSAFLAADSVADGTP